MARWPGGPMAAVARAGLVAWLGVNVGSDDDAANAFVGAIDEVAFYPRALSALDLERHRQAAVTSP